MKSQFDQTLLSSFYLWFENHLLSNKVKAYTTNVNNTFKYVDAYDIPTGYNAYQGGFRQLVADYNVDVPNSGFSSSSSFITGDSSISNVYFDYNNGRLIVPASSGKKLNLTSVSTVKEVNTYISNDDEEQIIIHGDFLEKGSSEPYFLSKTDKLDEKTYFLPACFIYLVNSNNKEFCFGGEEDTQSHIRVMVLSQNKFILESVLSSFRDTARECFTNIPYEDFPYGKFFSIKDFPYKYSELISQYSDKTFIQEVKTSKVNGSSIKEKLNKDFLIGFLDFDLSSHRFPRL